MGEGNTASLVPTSRKHWQKTDLIVENLLDFAQFQRIVK